MPLKHVTDRAQALAKTACSHAGANFRPLSLERIAALLQQRDFGGAFAAAQRMRVDLNYLVDFLGPAFEQHAAAFVQQIDSPDAVCDLVSALKPGSCVAPGCKYAYAAPAGGQARMELAGSDRAVDGLHVATGAEHLSPGGDAWPDKVPRCCAAIRLACERRGGAFLRAAIMSHLRCACRPCSSAEAVQVHAFVHLGTRRSKRSAVLGTQ